MQPAERAFRFAGFTLDLRRPFYVGAHQPRIPRHLSGWDREILTKTARYYFHE